METNREELPSPQSTPQIPQQQLQTILPQPIKPRISRFLLWIGFLIFLLLVVGGGYYFLSSQQQIEPTSSSAQDATPVLTIDSTLYWQTYTNSELGYSLQYLSNFNQFSDGYLSPHKECVSCVTPEGFFPNGSLVENTDSLSLDQLAIKKSGLENPRVEKVRNENATIVLLVNQSPASGPIESAYIKDNESSKIISLLFQLSDEDLVKQILSTFKFLGPNDIELIRFVKNKMKLSDSAIVDIESVEGNYALGGAGELDASGFYWAAAREGNQWFYIMGGNGIPECEEVEIFPVGTFNGKFDQCYQNSELITRK